MLNSPSIKPRQTVQSRPTQNAKQQLSALRKEVSSNLGVSEKTVTGIKKIFESFKTGDIKSLVGSALALFTIYLKSNSESKKKKAPKANSNVVNPKKRKKILP